MDTVPHGTGNGHVLDHESINAGDPDPVPQITFDYERAQFDIVKGVNMILRAIGEEPSREGLRKTPTRFANAILDLTRGYHMSATVAISDAIFHHDAISGDAALELSDIVLVKDIRIASLCEHHLLPFQGKLHVGYIPCGKVLGISKLARIAGVYARRLQLQERLTQEIANAIQKELGCHGVVVVAKCSHTCMSIRGIQQTEALTVTQCMTGVFREDASALQRFNSLLDI